jgi:hypothetical protein
MTARRESLPTPEFCQAIAVVGSMQRHGKNKA